MVKRDLIRNIILIIVVLLILLGLRLFVWMPYQVKDSDANLILHSGDQVVAMQLQKPKRGDFVLYQADGESHIGRVIGQEKDYVASMDNVLYVNHQAQSEDYLKPLKEKYLAKADQNNGYFTNDFTLETLTKSNLTAIPADQYLILNDNRRDHKDSRTYGLIKDNQIEGVITFRLSPLSQFGFIDNGGHDTMEESSSSSQGQW